MRTKIVIAAIGSAGMFSACSSGPTTGPRPPADETMSSSGTVATTVQDPETADASPSLAPSSTTIPAAVVPDEPAARVTAFDAMRVRATDAGVPLAESAVIVASACYGDQGRSHWGYFNNGALGGAISERDGAIVPLDAICLNPNQPDAYSSLLHEMGHRYFWQRGVWDSVAAEMGGLEHATECFAKAYGATTFGQGGCSDADVAHLMGWLGL